MNHPSSFDQFFTASLKDGAFAQYIDAALPPQEKDTFIQELQNHEKNLTEAARQLEAMNATFATPEALSAGNTAVPSGAQSPSSPTPDTSNKTGDPKGETLTVQVQHFARKE